MGTKKIIVTLTYAVEVEVDDRVNADDLQQCAYRTFEWSDGRYHLSVEMAEHAVMMVMRDFAGALVGAMASRRAEKYPNIRSRVYAFIDRIPKAVVGYRCTRVLSARGAGFNFVEKD